MGWRCITSDERICLGADKLYFHSMIICKFALYVIRITFLSTHQLCTIISLSVSPPPYRNHVYNIASYVQHRNALCCCLFTLPVPLRYHFFLLLRLFCYHHLSLLLFASEHFVSLFLSRDTTRLALYDPGRKK
jgi:hypothetical protein